MRTKLPVRRLVPLAAILAIPIGAHTSVSASAARPGPASVAVTRELSHLQHPNALRGLSVMHRLGSLTHSSLTGTRGMMLRAGQTAPIVHHATDRSRSDAQGSDLALPSDVIASGKGTQGAVGSGQGPFKALHTSWSGFSSGVAASFNFEPIMDLFYQGSVFTSAGSAQAYMNDSYNGLASGNPVPPQDCGSTVGYPCKIVGYETTSGLLAIYNVAQINQCVIETGYQGDPDQISANSDDVSKLTADIFLLGISEAQAACAGSSSTQPTATPRPTTQPVTQPTARPTQAPAQVPTRVPTTLEVVGCFQKNGSKPSSSPTCLHKAKRGQKVLLVVYTTVDSAPVGSNASVTATVKHGSSTVRNGSGSFTTDAANNLYYVYGSWKLPKKKGTYALHAQTTMNGVTVSDDETLKVS